MPVSAMRPRISSAPPAGKITEVREDCGTMGPVARGDRTPVQSGGLLHPGACGAGSVFAVEHTPGLRLVRRRPSASLDEVGLCPDFAFDGPRRNDCHLNRAFGRHAATGIHNVRVPVSPDTE